MIPRLCPPLWSLDPVGLDELVACAALQTRFDRKYLLPVQRVPELLAGLDPATRVLEIDGRRSFGYESVYFDTPDLVSYRLATYRRRRRFKIRTRTYLDSNQCWLEVKTRGARECTVKDRLPYEPAWRDAITPGRDYVDHVLDNLAIDSRRMSFSPTLISRYDRITLLLPGAAARVTIDTDLAFEAADCRRLHLPGLVIVETKTGATPSAVDRALWTGSLRPIRISKYGTGLAALRPDLPALPWRRTLRRHFPAPEGLGTTEAIRWLSAS
ncbi:polyphosphate polymerase domain-containing protein [Micromonospora sp. CPCC 206061]|uniref:polyphosphate polymerase domain-containing protein n=1 Tax=Micromonospora sp. CPCC 206061 TaxID=3122410 RepID=UPI002FF35863